MKEYEAPALRTLGTVHELTEAGDKCFLGKTIGPPDIIKFIPIANCSS